MTLEQKLVFGQVPPKEAVSRRRSEAAQRKPLPNQEVYGFLRASPFIDEALKREWEDEGKRNAQKRRQDEEGIIEVVLGRKIELPQTIPASTVCLRWLGYELLGYKPALPTPESITIMNIGSATHSRLLRITEQHLRGRQETGFDFEDLTGRSDFIYEHPLIKKPVIWEYKTVGDYPFRKITREGLPDYLRSTAKIYWPQPEHRNQALLYIWGHRQRQLDIFAAVIVYINRSTGEKKDALVIWDTLAEYDAEQLREKFKEAKARIDQGKLPEPSVESPHICAKQCPFSVHCDYGREFAAGRVKREQKRKPPWVYRRAREQAAETRRLMEELGLVQPELPGLEKDPAPHCGGCGGVMVWDARAARGGTLVCKNPGCSGD